MITYSADYQRILPEIGTLYLNIANPGSGYSLLCLYKTEFAVISPDTFEQKMIFRYHMLQENGEICVTNGLEAKWWQPYEYE